MLPCGLVYFTARLLLHGGWGMVIDGGLSSDQGHMVMGS